MDENSLRVLELSGPLVRSAGRMLVGIGCDVVLVEPPAGDDTRKDLDGYAFAHWHAGKRSVVLDPDSDSDASSFADLLRWADVVLDGRPVGASPPPDTTDRTVIVRVTPFGSAGPRSGMDGTDLTIAALGGMMAQVGEPEGPPLLLPEGQAEQLAGVNAAIAAVLGITARRAGHGGQTVDISAQECVAAALEAGTLAYLHEDRVPARPGRVHPLVPHGLFVAADGYLGGGLGGSPRMWDALVAWLTEMGTAEDLADPRWNDARVRKAEQQHIFDVLGRILGKWTKEEFASAAQDHRLPWAAVDRPDETVRNPQLNDRDFFVDLETPTGTIRDIGFGFAFPEGRRTTQLHVAALGEDQHDLSDLPPTSAPEPRIPRGSGALDGIRVLDLTWVLAGPYCTRILADHGAEVIKVESAGRPDPTRFAPFMHLSRDDTDNPNTSGYFNDVNRNKRSITLDTRSPEGIAVLRDLIASSDVVIENFSSSVMNKMGLGYDELNTLRPGIVYTSMSGMGHTGPRRDWVSYADIVSASSGLTALTGWSSEDVIGVIYGHGDIVAGLQAALATLAALEYRERTGRGQHVDLSQLEAMAAHMGTSVAGAAGAGVTAQPIGNGHRTFSPHGVFRCLGADRWCAITVRDVGEWESLCRVIGREDWVGDELLASSDARRAREKDICDAIEKWTRVRPTAIVEEALSRVGVPAGAVQDGRDLVENDVHLRDREFFVAAEHPVAGTFLHEGVPIRMSASPGGVRTAAPVLGADTDSVLSNILGYSHSRIEALRAADVLR